MEASSQQEFKASVLGAYERGERAISVPRLQRLARFYNVPVDQLLPRDLGPEPAWGDDIDLRGVDLDPKLAMGPERALRPQRDHDEADPPGEDLFRRPLVIDLGEQPCEVAVARLHDRAFGDHLVESIAVLVVGGDSRPYVGDARQSGGGP